MLAAVRVSISSTTNPAHLSKSATAVGWQSSGLAQPHIRTSGCVATEMSVWGVHELHAAGLVCRVAECLHPPVAPSQRTL